MLERQSAFEDFRPPTNLKLSLLWASLMFCYVYGDYFGLYAPGKLLRMNAGEMGGFGQISPGALAAIAMMMALPALMVALSILLPALLVRWLNITLGLIYSAIMLLTMVQGAPPFYLVLGAIEIVVCLAIVLIAIRWPRIIPAADL